MRKIFYAPVCVCVCEREREREREKESTRLRVYFRAFTHTDTIFPKGDIAAWRHFKPGDFYNAS